MLEVKDATIKAGGRVLATGLSFIARDGQLTCITGPAGAGKTTLLRTLMGFLPVGEGFVSVDGELLTVYSAYAFRSLVVYLPQQMQCLRHHLAAPEAPVCTAADLTVWGEGAEEPLAVGSPVAPLSPEEIFALAEQTLHEATDKQIVIADEPAALLSPDLALRMLDLLHEQARRGKTVLIASRRPLLVDRADQVIEMKSE